MIEEEQSGQAWTLDKDSEVPIYSPVCTFCQHLRGHRCCMAFGVAPIPLAIWTGKNDHREPHSGDHGIQFGRVG